VLDVIELVEQVREALRRLNGFPDWSRLVEFGLTSKPEYKADPRPEIEVVERRPDGFTRGCVVLVKSHWRPDDEWTRIASMTEVSRLEKVPGITKDALAVAKAEGLVAVRQGRAIVGTGDGPGREPGHWILKDKGEATLAARRMNVKPMPENGAKVKPDDVPAECRERGQHEGAILDAPYLAETNAWNFTSVELTDAINSGELTYRIKVGRPYVYRYDELCKLREKRKEKRKA
jgi:hypothetical protein